MIEYKECYDNGNIHDGMYAKLKWTPDTVFLNIESTVYKAVFGDNGYVCKLLCLKGYFNFYYYDDSRYLTKYNFCLTRNAPDEFVELNWEDDNVTKARRYYRYSEEYEYEDRNIYYEDLLYTYGKEENVAGLLPQTRVYNWIMDSGVGYDVNIVLYYAGLLGKGTRNLPIASSNLYYNGQKNQSYEFIYSINEKGYVDVVSLNTKYGNNPFGYEGSNSYFYTE